MSSSTTPTSNAEVYRSFVSEISSKFPKFKPLNSFIHSNTQLSPKNITYITVINFSPTDGPSEARDITESDLETELAKEVNHQLFVVENISPVVLAQLGGYCNVDPQFFLDHIDASLLDENKTASSSSHDKELEPIPWYRFRNIEEHIPMLRSMQSGIDHVHLRFIGCREYHSEESHRIRVELPDRIVQSQGRCNIERIAGGYNLIPRDGEWFHPVALTRHGATAWFGKQRMQDEWSKGIILLDPPFEETAQDFGLRQSSKYRSFVSRPLPQGVQKKDLDFRATYMSSLVHCLKFSETVQAVGVPHPLIILQDLYRIIASEWITVNTYIEKDLNTIAWQLEKEKMFSLENLEDFLGELFILRRRIGRYQSLIDEQYEVYRRQMPRSWNCSKREIREVFSAIQDDFEQVQQSIKRNVARITESVDLITSIMSIRAGQVSVIQNDTLSFLTLVATVALPFNLVATIMAMQTDYGPGQSKFWIFWTTSVAAFLCVWVGFGLYKALKRKGRNFRTGKVR